jgi:hypothetical protein
MSHPNPPARASALVLVLILAGCQPVIQSSQDDPPWLGIAQSPQIEAFIDSAAVHDTNPIVHSILRFRYAELQRLGDHPPFAESRTVVDIDCANKRARSLDLRVFGPDGAQLGSTSLDPPDAAWKAFGEHPLSTYFLAACIRMGRVRGRLVPNKRLKLSGLLLMESAVTSPGGPPRGGQSLAPAGTPPAA